MIISLKPRTYQRRHDADATDADRAVAAENRCLELKRRLREKDREIERLMSQLNNRPWRAA
jgi:hypothetical protein